MENRFAPSYLLRKALGFLKDQLVDKLCCGAFDQPSGKVVDEPWRKQEASQSYIVQIPSDSEDARPIKRRQAARELRVLIFLFYISLLPRALLHEDVVSLNNDNAS